jgi:hypothetical protein
MKEDTPEETIGALRNENEMLRVDFDRLDYLEFQMGIDRKTVDLMIEHHKSFVKRKFEQDKAWEGDQC